MSSNNHFLERKAIETDTSVFFPTKISAPRYTEWAQMTSISTKAK